MHERRQFGNKGEEDAAAFLLKQGWTILEKQYRSPFGEVDLIALDRDIVVFVEVKSRRSSAYGFPEESVTKRKRRHLAAAAHCYLTVKGWEERPFRIDVLSLLYDTPSPTIEHFPSVDMG